MSCLWKGRQSPNTPAEAVALFCFSVCCLFCLLYEQKATDFIVQTWTELAAVRQYIRTCSIIRRGSHVRKRVFDQVLQLTCPEQSNGHIQAISKTPMSLR